VLDAFDVSFFSSGKRMRIACCHSNPSSSLLWRWSRIIFRRFGDIGQICYIFVTIFVKFLYMLYFCFFLLGLLRLECCLRLLTMHVCYHD
jgi:hypothetical protein